MPGLGQLTAKFFDIKNRGGATGHLACVKRHGSAAARKVHATRVAPRPLVGKTMLRRGPLRDSSASLGAIFVPCAWKQRTGNNRTTVVIREFFFFLFKALAEQHLHENEMLYPQRLTTNKG